MLKKLAILALGFTLTGAALPGYTRFMSNPALTIEKAVNSPVITLKIKESRATMVELVVNGRSVSTRALTASEDEQDVRFHLDLTDLEEGDNRVEARLFDASGNLIGTEQSKVTLDAQTEVPVEIVNPKQGQTLQGLVEIKIDMKRRFNKPYVSFMINGEWKAIRNFDPFAYVWDTETVGNGWHELQVWVVGDDNVTVRSRKLRVFVNNPGGRTDRIPAATAAAAVAPVVPQAVPVGALMGPTVVGTLAKPVMARPQAMTTPATATSVRMLTPTGKRVVAPAVKPAVKAPTPTKGTLPAVSGTKPVIAPKPPVAAPKPAVAPKVTPIATAAQTVTITRGTRVPNLSQLSIAFGGVMVNFPDVQPFVQEGVALTPFRHLYQHAGGKVQWKNETKTVDAKSPLQRILIQIGKQSASVDGKTVTLERVPFLRNGRTIVPLSFIREALRVNVQLDPKTGHVLITAPK